MTTGSAAKLAEPSAAEKTAAPQPVSSVGQPAPQAAPAPATKPVAMPQPANAPNVNLPPPARPSVIRPVVRSAPMGLRHIGLMLSFLLLVIAPIGLTVWYMETRATDQYASTLAFTVRSEEMPSANDLLGGIGTALGGSASKDSDILYEFIRSQEIVEAINAEIDLEAIYARHHARDPVFGYAPGGTTEDLLSYWQRMVRIAYDSSAGMLELRVLAFTPEEAQRIAELIRAASEAKINDLSITARADMLRYATDDLDRALDYVKTAREQITAFRIENQIVDVNADIQGQMGILGILEEQLASALIDFDLLRSSAREGDPRLQSAESLITVIEARIEQERAKIGGATSASNYAETVGEFERLTIEREFAESRYLAAMRAYELAQSEANRRNRYLVTYIGPTLAQAPEFPRSLFIILGVALF